MGIVERCGGGQLAEDGVQCVCELLVGSGALLRLAEMEGGH